MIKQAEERDEPVLDDTALMAIGWRESAGRLQGVSDTRILNHRMKEEATLQVEMVGPHYRVPVPAITGTSPAGSTVGSAVRHGEGKAAGSSRFNNVTWEASGFEVRQGKRMRDDDERDEGEEGGLLKNESDEQVSQNSKCSIFL
jgi:hypothetical protein